MVDDLSDVRLRRLLPPGYTYLAAKYLGSTPDTVRSVASILGLPCASEAFHPVLRHSTCLTPAWMPYLQALIDAIASRTANTESMTVTPCQALQLSFAGKTLSVYAFCDGGRLYLGGEPAAFAAEAAVEMLNMLALSSNGEICARLGVALFLLDDREKFVEAAQQIATQLDVDFVTPVAVEETQDAVAHESDADDDASDPGHAHTGGRDDRETEDAVDGAFNSDKAASAHGQRGDMNARRHAGDRSSDRMRGGAHAAPSANGERGRNSNAGADNFGILVKRDGSEFNLDPWSKPQDTAEASERDDVDLSQREAAAAYERQHGRMPTIREFSQWGYDIESVDGQGRIRRIEVKGMKGEWRDSASVVLSRRQAHDALTNGNIMVSYWLYVVDDLGDRCEVFPVPWTAQGLKFGFYASHWRALAEKMRALDDQMADGNVADR